MKPEGEQKKLSLFFRLAFGMGNMLNVLSVVGLWFPYAVSFFSKVLSLHSHQVGTIVLVGQVAGGVFTPLTGMLSDVCKCRIYGRRKILHLLGMLSTASSFYFLWHNCYGCKSEISYTIYFSVFAIMFQFGYAAMQVAPLALVPELAPSKQMKVELNSIRYGFQISGTLLAFAILFVLLNKLPKASIPEDYGNNITNCDNGDSPLNYGDRTAFWVMAIIVIGLGVLIVMPFHVVVREKNTVLKKLKWYLWLLKPDFYLVMCVFVAAKISAIFAQQYLPFYFLDTLKMNQNSISIGPLVLYVASFVSTICVKRINKFIGEKMLYFLGTVLVWGAMMWIWVQPVEQSEATFSIKRDSIYIAVILWGLGGSVLMVLSLSMISILTGEYTGSSAFVCGWVLFADRVSNGVLNKIALQLKPSNPDCSEACELRDAVFYRQLIVFTTFASTVMGLVGICLLALWDYYQRRQMKKMFGNIQIRDTVGDTSSVYSEKIAGTICCSKCREHSDEIDGEQQSLIHEPAFATDERQQSLLESYREQLLTSSYHDQHQLQDDDFEVSLAT